MLEGHFFRPFVEASRERLRACAELLGWQQTEDDHAAVYLVVDGERVSGTWRCLSACFVLPAAARNVWLD